LTSDYSLSVATCPFATKTGVVGLKQKKSQISDVNARDTHRSKQCDATGCENVCNTKRNADILDLKSDGTRIYITVLQQMVSTHGTGLA
jgi:hypothetical protein